MSEESERLSFFHPKRLGFETLCCAEAVLFWGIGLAVLGLALSALAYLVALFGGCPKEDAGKIVLIVSQFLPKMTIILWGVIVTLFVVAPRVFLLVLAFLWGGFQIQTGLDRLSATLKTAFLKPNSADQRTGLFRLYLKWLYFFGTSLISAELTSTLLFTAARAAWNLPLSVGFYALHTGIFLLAVFFITALLTTLVFFVFLK